MPIYEGKGLQVQSEGPPHHDRKMHRDCRCRARANFVAGTHSVSLLRRRLSRCRHGSTVLLRQLEYHCTLGAACFPGRTQADERGGDTREVLRTGQKSKEAWRLMEQTMQAERIMERPKQNRPNFIYHPTQPSRSMQEMSLWEIIVAQQGANRKKNQVETKKWHQTKYRTAELEGNIAKEDVINLTA
jgi:hypothetical protein